MPALWSPPVRPRPLCRSRFAAAFAPLLALLVLAGCTSEDNFPPACPVPSILGDAGDLARYHARGNPNAPASGHDLRDMVLQAQITGLQGSCKWTNETQKSVTSMVSLHLLATRGPAATGRADQLAYFIAVMHGDAILDKQVYPVALVFPPNADQVTAETVPLKLVVPTPKGTTAADFQIVAGFQLTPEELARNRAAPH